LWHAVPSFCSFIGATNEAEIHVINTDSCFNIAMPVLRSLGKGGWGCSKVELPSKSKVEERLYPDVVLSVPSSWVTASDR
jgi:hypothetical protein